MGYARICASLIAFFAVAGAPCATAVTLTTDDLARASIVITTEADEYVRFAARDLQHHLEAMTGVRVRIGDAQNEGFRFLIGGLDANQPLLGSLGPDGGDGAFGIAIDEDSARVIGASSEGTANGVYEILEQLGCRWYFPGETGTYVPKRTVLELMECYGVVRPSFSCRRGIDPGPTTWPVPDDFRAQERVWAMRNRAGGWRWHGAGHSYQYLVPEGKHYGGHPEYFALLDGKRSGPNLCTANDDAVKAAAATALEWMKGNPQRVICVSPPDGGDFWCECELCRRRYPEGEANISDRVSDFANRVGEIVVGEYPETYITYYIYAEYVEPPKKYLPREFVMGWFTLWGTTGMTNHVPFTAEQNKRARDLFEVNAALYDTMGIHPYYGHYNWFTHWPMMQHIAVDMPYWHEHKVKLFYSETHTNWATQWWNFYVMYKYAWDVTSEIEGIRTEFYRDFCGNAGEALREYDDLINEAFASEGQIVGTHGEDRKRYTPEVLEKGGELMKKAAREAAAQGSPFTERIAFLEKGYRITQLWCAAQHELDAFGRDRIPERRKHAVALMTELAAFLNRPENAGMVETHNLNFTKVIEDRIAAVQGGTVFPRGEFHYHDGLDGGGKALFHAAAVEGMTAGTYGWVLRKGATGHIAWDVKAQEGAFKSLRMVLLAPANVTVEASTDGGASYTAISADKTSSNRWDAPEYDLTGLAEGRPSIRVRVTAVNPRDVDVTALDVVEFKGVVK